ncbi:MAG: hypothetical protein HY840_05700 [Bacteroidetes bacterium]|nr:hypothetical protein [Bacteroidota bacterium]
MDSVAKANWILADTTMRQEVRTKRAMELIDKSITHPDAINSSYAWYTRGLIYKEWYKTFEKQNKKSKTRLDAVEFLKKALSLDKSQGRPIAIENKIEYNGNIYLVTDVYNAANIKTALKYIGSRFQNDAVYMLDTINYQAAIQNYEKFKECMLIADPKYNFRSTEMEFKTALADQYGNLFLNNIKTNKQFLKEAESTYKAVITLDTNYFNAIHGLALLYYNYGVDIINSMPLDVPIMEVDKIQDEARTNFRKALPYALKAYALKPKKKEVLIALQGIYFSLYEFEKSDVFKARLDKLPK